jgi:monothiol glutaredoxin
MSLDDATRERIEDLVRQHPVLLFMKGDRRMPQCGFSATVVRVLDSLIPEYATHDVLSDPEVRDGIKAYSSWPTIPQLYVKGEFLGGCDIVQEMFATGELHERLGLARPAPAQPPSITVTPAAREALAQAVAQSRGGELHLAVDAGFENQLYVGPRQPGELEARAEGISVLVDPMTAQRAEGVIIDVVETPQGRGFRIDNPNAPGPRVNQLPVSELVKWLEARRSFEFIDVRTPTERAQASIEGTLLLTPEEQARLESLPRHVTLVFHCHHGGRSQRAAEHFATLGFSDVHNVVGGIDAWSAEIDPSVPRY